MSLIDTCPSLQEAAFQTALIIMPACFVEHADSFVNVMNSVMAEWSTLYPDRSPSTEEEYNREIDAGVHKAKELYVRQTLEDLVSMGYVVKREGDMYELHQMYKDVTEALDSAGDL